MAVTRYPEAMTLLPGAIRSTKTVVGAEWEHVGVHPTIASMSTNLFSRKISAMVPTDEGLILGYGDWNDNLGPVDVIAYDEDANPLVLHENSPTEAFDRIRVIDGKVYMPWTDPRGSGPGGFTTNRSGHWEDVPSPVMLHTFDVIVDNGLVSICGSVSAGGGNGQGAVFRESADGTWTETLRGGALNPWTRFYSFFAGEGGRPHVQSRSGTTMTWYLDVGGEWVANHSHPPVYTDNSADETPITGLPEIYHRPGRQLWVEYAGYIWSTSTDGEVYRARVGEV